MVKFIKIGDKGKWQSAYEVSEEEIRNLIEKYSKEYPESDVDYLAEDYGEWIPNEQQEGEEVGYWSAYICYKLIIRFKNDADEAEFIMKESI